VSGVLRCACHGYWYPTVREYLEAHSAEDEQLELDLRGARSEHYVGNFEDGSQVLLEVYATGKMTAATRSSRRATWGPPAMLDEAP
jgi:hypothetical protein